jgi:hypothetical protein
MDPPVMRPAQQGQVQEVGGAAIDPMPQMMRVAAGQGPLAAREDATAVAHGQGGPLGGMDDPGRAANLQRLAGRPTQLRGQQDQGLAEPVLEPYRLTGVGVVAG